MIQQNDCTEIRISLVSQVSDVAHGPSGFFFLLQPLEMYTPVSLNEQKT